MNVEQSEESSTCSIFTAAAKGNIERMSILLSQGASVNSTDETEETLLRLAYENVCSDCVKYPPNNGADVNGDKGNGVNEGDKGADVKGVKGDDVNDDKGANVKGDEGVDVKGYEGVDVKGDEGDSVNEGRLPKPLERYILYNQTIDDDMREDDKDSGDECILNS